jgi:hypothetical protein
MGEGKVEREPRCIDTVDSKSDIVLVILKVQQHGSFAIMFSDTRMLGKIHACIKLSFYYFKKTKKLLDSGTENMASLGMIFGKNKEKFNHKSLHHLL